MKYYSRISWCYINRLYYTIIWQLHWAHLSTRNRSYLDRWEGGRSQTSLPGKSYPHPFCSSRSNTKANVRYRYTPCLIPINYTCFSSYI